MGAIKGEQFELNKLKIGEAEGTTFMKASLTYEGMTPVIEVEEEISFYRNTFDGRKSYSVGIKFDNFNFKELENKMVEFASESFPGDKFKLIKQNGKGDSIIYCKAATDILRKPEKVCCKIGGKKGKYVEFDDLCRVRFIKAKSEIRLLYAFRGKACGFTLEARNIVHEQ